MADVEKAREIDSAWRSYEHAKAKHENIHVDAYLDYMNGRLELPPAMERPRSHLHIHSA